MTVKKGTSTGAKSGLRIEKNVIPPIPLVKKPAAKKPKEITSLSVQADLKKVQSDNSLLINRKIKAGQNVKIDLIVKNRLRVLLNQLNRFMRLDTKKYA